MVQTFLTPEVLKQLNHAADEYVYAHKELDSEEDVLGGVFLAGAICGYLAKCKELIGSRINEINKSSGKGYLA